VARLTDLKLGTRLLLIPVVVFIFTALILVFFYFQMGSLRAVSTEQTGEAVMNGLREKVQVSTNAMAESLSVLLSELSDQADNEAREHLLREAVKDIRFEEDESGYFFVYRDTTVITVPTNTSLQGRDLENTADDNGVRFVADLAQAAASGGGFVNYVFEKPGAGIQPKVSYATMIPGTPYWIGTGVYADTVAHQQDVVAELINAQTQRSLLLSAGGILGFFVLIMVPLMVVIVRSIGKPISRLVDMTKQVADGDLTVKADDALLAQKDEVGELVQAIDRMVEKLRDVIGSVISGANNITAARD